MLKTDEGEKQAEISRESAAESGESQAPARRRTRVQRKPSSKPRVRGTRKKPKEDAQEPAKELAQESVPQPQEALPSAAGDAEPAFLFGSFFDPAVMRRGRQAEKREALAKSEKLQKVLADAGMGSRRDMEQMILEGRITVNAKPAYIGQRVMPDDEVRMNGVVVKRAELSDTRRVPRVLVYNNLLKTA